MKLTRKFFIQPTLKVAKEMLGKFLIREINGKKVGGMIVETEAYIGPEDRASHAFGGKVTSRNKAEYLIGGHVYIYLVYGMYWQLNISTGQEGSPECVLIRALEPTDGIDLYKHSDGDRRRFIRHWRRNRLSIRISRDHSRASAIRMLANGPGKLCRFLKLDKSFYGYDICQKNSIFYIEDRKVEFKFNCIESSPRIGIDYAGPHWSKVPWRFYIHPPKFSKKILEGQKFMV